MVNTYNVPGAVEHVQTMMNIYPQTLDIQDGTPDLKIALIVEAMENRNDMTSYIKCEYCGCKIRTKERFNQFETDKCKRIKEQQNIRNR